MGVIDWDALLEHWLESYIGAQGICAAAQWHCTAYTQTTCDYSLLSRFPPYIFNPPPLSPWECTFIPPYRGICNYVSKACFILILKMTVY